MSPLKSSKDTLTSSVLPPELLYHVFEQCAGDLSTLQSCTLLSKMYQEAAQHCLLSRVFVYPGRLERSVYSLVKFLDARPDLRSFIKDVHITLLPNTRLVPGTVRVNELHSLLFRVSPLRALTILAGSIFPGQDSSDVSNAVPITTPSCKVDFLLIQDSWIHHAGARMRTLQDIFSSFSSIGTLSIHNVAFVDDQPHQSQSASPLPDHLPRVHSLDIAGAPFGFEDELVQCLAAQEVEVLYVRARALLPNDYAPYQRLLNAATSLRKIEFWTLIVNRSFDQPLLSLRSCPQLETITFVLGVFGSDIMRQVPAWKQVSLVLSSLPRISSLAGVRLILVAPASATDSLPDPQLESLLKMGWNELHEALRRFDKISTVDIMVKSSYVPDFLKADEVGDPGSCLPAVVNTFGALAKELSSESRSYNVNIVYPSEH